jgi:hypothetical protein
MATTAELITAVFSLEQLDNSVELSSTAIPSTPPRNAKRQRSVSPTQERSYLKAKRPVNRLCVRPGAPVIGEGLYIIPVRQQIDEQENN